LSVTRTFTAPSTTCAFVRMRPSGDTITPDPSPARGAFSGAVCGEEAAQRVGHVSRLGSAFNSTRMVTTAARRARRRRHMRRPAGPTARRVGRPAPARRPQASDRIQPERRGPRPAPMASASTPAPIASRARTSAFKFSGHGQSPPGVY
jgi:hypothetical protein